jgi:histidinol dehydrogenase
MKIVRWNELAADAQAQLLRRPAQALDADVRASVMRIIEQVRADGDGAVRALTRRFDGVEIATLEVSEEEFTEARALVAPELFAAMAEARERLIAWHRAGMAAPFEIETAPGVRCGRILRGIGRVGLYVPAGSAPLPSTALMLGVPAALAECAEVILCTPPQTNGKADPMVLLAARLCGINRVFKIGGAQAIAAMAFGTASVPACDKLFGPGNGFVTAAKQQVSTMTDGAAIDLPAGPSEVLVIADQGVSAIHVASDLLSQAEHGADSQVLLISDSMALIEQVQTQIERQLRVLPRAETARRALEHARLIWVKTLDSAFAISNEYAPEHLILAVNEPKAWLSRVRRAGSVFLGDYAPESLGDYCSGTNHVLPTNGAARAYSGVSVASFQTSISIQSVTREGLAAIGPCAVTLARAEGLEAHAQAVLLRLAQPA